MNRTILLSLGVAGAAAGAALQALFPCSELPLLSAGAGGIAGGALVGSIAFFSQRGLERKFLGVVMLCVAAAAAFLALMYHICS